MTTNDRTVLDTNTWLKDNASPGKVTDQFLEEESPWQLVMYDWFIPNPHKRKPPFVNLSKSMYFSQWIDHRNRRHDDPSVLCEKTLTLLRSGPKTLDVDDRLLKLISPARMGWAPPSPVHDIRVTRPCPTPRTAGSAPPSPDTGAWWPSRRLCARPCGRSASCFPAAWRGRAPSRPREAPACCVATIAWKIKHTNCTVGTW